MYWIHSISRNTYSDQCSTHPIVCIFLLFIPRATILLTMSVTRKIAHNMTAQIIGKVLSAALGLVAVGMMTRYLGQEQFGWYVTVITFLQFVAILIDFGLIPVSAQMLAEKKMDEKTLIQNLLGFRFATAILLLAITPAIALFFPYPQEVKIAISFTTLSFLAVAMNQIALGYHQSTLKTYIQAIGEVTGRIGLVIGLWLMIYMDAGFLPIMAIVTFSSVLYTAVTLVSIAKDGLFGLRFDMDVWKIIWQHAWPIAMAIVFNVVYLKGDTLLLSLFRSQSEVGIYGAAYRVVDILAQAAMMLIGLMLPLMAHAWSNRLSDEFRVRYQQSFDLLMILAVPMVAGLVYLAEPIMVFVAGEDFAASAIALRILALAVFGVYLGAVFGHAVVAIKKQKFALWIYLSNAILTLAGYLYFIPRFGMTGAAWMSVFSELYAGFLLFLLVRTVTKQRLIIKTFGKIILGSVTMILVLAITPDIHVLVDVCIGAVTYGLVLIATQAISHSTLKEIVSKA